MTFGSVPVENSEYFIVDFVMPDFLDQELVLIFFIVIRHISFLRGSVESPFLVSFDEDSSYSFGFYESGDVHF